MKRSGVHERLEKSHVTESKLFDVLQIQLRRPLRRPPHSLSIGFSNLRQEVRHSWIVVTNCSTTCQSPQVTYSEKLVT